VYVEIVPTDTLKYELDKNTGHLRVDRPQRYSSLCPTVYGFLPRTYCGPLVAARASERARLPDIEGDGDPLDICVLTERDIVHDVFVSARPIGGLRMIDGMQADDKIIAVLESDITHGHLRDLSECPAGIVDRLQHYFLSYKQRPDEPNRKVQIAETYGASEALEVIRRSTVDYADRFGDADLRLDELRKLLGSR
jgi:inorganic pyrophosphatase